MLRRIYYSFSSLIIVSAIAIVLQFVQVLNYAEQSYSGQAEVAITLGAAVWTERPSPVFKERINHAVQLYLTKRVKYLIFTGGLAQGDKLTEAESARRYALSHGVADEHIFIESLSKNTFENIKYAQEIMAKKEWSPAVVVSDPIHMKRAMLYAGALNMQAHSSPTPSTLYRSTAKRFQFGVAETYLILRYRLAKIFS